MSAPAAAPAAGTPIGLALLGAELLRAARFYGELLGWTFPTSPATSRVFDAAGLPVATVSPVPDPVTAETARAGTASWWTILCAPADPRQIHAAGGRVLGAVAGTTYVADPVGATFAVADPIGATFGAPTPAGAPAPAGPGRPVWFEIMTTDGPASDHFYNQVFGLVAQPTQTEPDYALLLAEARPVAGRLVLPPPLDNVLGVRWMPYLAHLDIDQAATHVTELGGTVLVPPRETPTGRVTAVADADGAVFTLLTRT